VHAVDCGGAPAPKVYLCPCVHPNNRGHNRRCPAYRRQCGTVRRLRKFVKADFQETSEFSGRQKAQLLTVRWNDLLGVLPMIGLAYSGHGVYTSLEDGETVAQ